MAIIDDELKSRISTYASVRDKLANLSDTEVINLIQSTGDAALSIGGSSYVLRLDDVPIFVKKVKLSDLERQNMLSTQNFFNLPMCYQYGVGSTGFGAWRELAVHQMTTEWVLKNQCIHFPILYSYRIVSHHKDDLSQDKLNKIERDVDYWEGSESIRMRLLGSALASAELILFLEYFPENLYQWLTKEIKKGNEALISSCNLLERELKLTLDFISSHGLLHMDVHFWNILTDGKHLYFSDFGLALSEQFDLSEQEVDFINNHRKYDYCCAATNFLYAIITGLYGHDDWIGKLRKIIHGKLILPEEIRLLISHYSTIAIAMDEFYNKLKFSSKSTPFKE